jgi:type II secretory ATPase GspE/PulE/Tfp pilus assembly ATPase PilB-like protein
MLDPNQPEVARAVLEKTDAQQIAALAAAGGMQTLQQAADQAVLEGLTTREEVLRVLGGR